MKEVKCVSLSTTKDVLLHRSPSQLWHANTLQSGQAFFLFPVILPESPPKHSDDGSLSRASRWEETACAFLLCLLLLTSYIYVKNLGSQAIEWGFHRSHGTAKVWAKAESLVSPCRTEQEASQLQGSLLPGNHSKTRKRISFQRRENRFALHNCSLFEFEFKACCEQWFILW